MAKAISWTTRREDARGFETKEDAEARLDQVGDKAWGFTILAKGVEEFKRRGQDLFAVFADTETVDRESIRLDELRGGADSMTGQELFDAIFREFQRPPLDKRSYEGPEDDEALCEELRDRCTDMLADRATCSGEAKRLYIYRSDRA